MEIFYSLMVIMIIGSIIAVETTNLLSAVISVGAVGFGASIMFLFLRAPDIALTQIVIEVFCLIILIRATIARDKTFISGDREFFGMIVSVVILLVIFLAGVRLFESMPQFGQAVFVIQPEAASQVYIRDGLAATGATNIVSAVYLDYRAYDTLGEATVLFTSIIGAVVILRKPSRQNLAEELK